MGKQTLVCQNHFVASLATAILLVLTVFCPLAPGVDSNEYQSSGCAWMRAPSIPQAGLSLCERGKLPTGGWHDVMILSASVQSPPDFPADDLAELKTPTGLPEISAGQNGRAPPYC